MKFKSALKKRELNEVGEIKSKSSLDKTLFVYFILSLFIFLFSSIHQVHALGVAPGERPFTYEGGQIEYELRIMNDEGRDAVYSLDVNGELSKYVTLSKKSVSFTPQKSDEVIMVKFFIPPTEEIHPGEYTIRINVNSEEGTRTGVMALVGVVSKLVINIPGDDAYIKFNSYVPNFIKNQENSFAIDISNKGVKTATNCFASIDIKNSINPKVASLISKSVNIQGMKTEKIVLPWTPNEDNGIYLAQISVICDETSTKEEKPFSIGSPNIKIINFVSSDFTLGQINRFDLILESEWGQKIETVYADAEFVKDGVSLTKEKTKSVDVNPAERISLPVYLNTKDMSPGEYSLYLMLHYLGKDEGKIYNVQVFEDKIVIEQLSGMVVGSSVDTSSSKGSNTLLIVAIIVIVIFNIILISRLIKKKKES